jgi:hypothetical protein
MNRLALLALLPGCFLFRSSPNPSCQEGRTVELSLPEDVKKFAGCERASGIQIRTGATIDVAPLSDLEEITGNLSVGPTVGVESISFNGLVRVGGTIHVANNGSMHGLFLPRLEYAGRIEVDNNAVLTTISMPRLAHVEGSLVITDNASLELITTTRLVDVGQELVVAGQPKLNLFEIPLIQHMQSIRLERDPKLPPDVVQRLMAKAEVAEVVVVPPSPSPPSPQSPAPPPVDAGVSVDATSDANP